MLFGETCKLLILWSGRRGSNPRRPAWEIDRRLQIQNLASTASTDGDRITHSFNGLLRGSRYRSKNGAKNSFGLTSIFPIPTALTAKLGGGSTRCHYGRETPPRQSDVAPPPGGSSGPEPFKADLRKQH